MSKKLNLTVSKNDEIETYLTKFNSYGNRNTLVVNKTTKEYITSGTCIGELGTVTENCLNKELKVIEKQLMEEGYTETYGTVKRA